MVQPKSPPLSIRLSPDTLAKLDTECAERGLTRHGLIVQLVMIGLAQRGVLAGRAPSAKVEPWAEGAVKEAIRDMLKSQGERFRSDMEREIAVQIGPIRAKPGERAKKPKPGKK